jgi:sugar lactone lactonase YvrE
MIGITVILSSGVAWSDDVFVTNNGGNSVEEIVNGVTSTLVPSTSGTLNSPTGIAVYGNNLFVANNGSGTDGTGYVAEFNDMTGAFEGDYASSLSQPRGLVFDSFGNMYVANQDGGTITEVPAGGGPAEIIVTNLPFAEALTFDSAGNLYVTNSESSTDAGNNIEKITLTDGAVDSVTTFATTGLNNPIGLTYVGTGSNAGNFFVVNNSDSVLEFDSAGQPVQPSPLAQDMNSLGGSNDIAADSAGDFYVTDNTDGSVMEFDSSGQLLNNYTSGFIGPCYLTTLVVPEPSTYALMAASLGLILFLGRRKAAKRSDLES